MTITVEITFPLGRYHATPWDRHVNEGAIEWPPSPWRLARALYAVWKERMPELDDDDVVAALDAISAPPVYHLPPWTGSATRHYYPDAAYLSGPMKPSIDKVLDAFVAVHPEAPLTLSWPEADLLPGPSAVLASLVEGLPFLGRADSVCTASTTMTAPVDGGRTLAPTETGDMQVAAPVRPLDINALTITTDRMRKQRLRQPPGMVQIPYQSPVEERPSSGLSPASDTPSPEINAAVFSATGRPPPSSTLAVAVADLFFAAAEKGYTRLTGSPAPPVLTGHPADSSERRTDQHRHAHVWPLPRDPGAKQVQQVVVWAKEGFDPATSAALGQVTELRLSKKAPGSKDHVEVDTAGRPVVRGLLPTRVLLTQLGKIDELAPGLVRSSSHWVSCTPFIPPHHQRKGQRIGERFGSYYKGFLIDQIDRELKHRGFAARLIDLRGLGDDERPGAAQRYRRHRLKQRMRDAREAVWLEVHLDQPLKGPLALGGLCHYGLGLFRPKN
ncbi:type I-G CRISPR-associated protein Csb2 [Iamia sp.]|uniref:type I-G CRISPR-associated protein Csb2 n=1 Tax=Iamia sp. TaxID=2722710 RepID=UPI002C04D7C5|nr:type I-U CRISPR-associated protein Csb2 [Iamia sp.]HXH58595.1 type I-U CRISPR-associated protein Csb2 [Iamia sp.]